MKHLEFISCKPIKRSCWYKGWGRTAVTAFVIMFFLGVVVGTIINYGIVFQK